MADDWEDVPSPSQEDVYALARMVASEAGGTPEVAQRAVAHAALNHAAGRPISEILKQAKGGAGGRYGSQDEGRYASTAKEPTPTSLRIAQDALTGASKDPTGGATQWDSPQAYPDPSRADVVAASRAKEGKRIVTLPGVPSSVFRFYAKGAGAAAGDDGDWQDVSAPSRVSPPAWGGLTDYSGENKAGPVTDEVQNQTVGDQDLSQTRAARAEANGWSPEDQLKHDVLPTFNPTPEEGARGLASMAAGGIAGIYAGQIPKLAAMAQEGGLGARMASGAAQGAVSAVASDPTPDRNHQIANLILGGGLGAMGMAGRAPRESAFVPGTQGAVDEAAYRAVGAEPTLAPGGTRGGMFATPEYKALPEGAMGTQQKAAELEALLNSRMEQRGQANNEMIGADQKAMAQTYRDQVSPDGILSTDPALIEIARIRQQQMGANGSFMPEQDARLAWAQEKLKTPPEEGAMDAMGAPAPQEAPPQLQAPAEPEPNYDPQMEARVRDLAKAGFHVPGARPWTPSELPYAPRDAAQYMPDPEIQLGSKDIISSKSTVPPEPPLPEPEIISSEPATPPEQRMTVEEAQKLWHALNYRIKNAQPGDMGTAGDRQAAGVVADMVQNADPRLGPGNLEGTAHAYGKEKDALATLSDLLYRSDSGKPADRVGQQAAGIQRLGNAGATSEKGTVGQANEQKNLRQIEQIEPASSPLMAEIRARRTKERREIGLRGGVSVAGAVARSTIGNASNMLFRGQGGGVSGTTPDQLILTIEELRKYNEMRRKQQEGQR